MWLFSTKIHDPGRTDGGYGKAWVPEQMTDTHVRIARIENNHRLRQAPRNIRQFPRTGTNQVELEGAAGRDADWLDRSTLCPGPSGGDGGRARIGWFMDPLVWEDREKSHETAWRARHAAAP